MSDTLSADEAKYFETGGAEAPEPDGQQQSEPEAQAEPEQRQEPEADAGAKKARDDKGKFVPHSAMHEERERRKAAEARAERTEAMLQQILQQQRPAQHQAAQQEQAAIPDFNADPRGWIEGQLAALRQQVQPIQQYTQQQHQAMQEQQAVAQLQGWAGQQVEAFKATAPDYTDAEQHLMQARDRQLQVMGVTDQQQRNLMIRQEALRVAHDARQAGANPAERLYEIAKVFGYQPKGGKQDAGKLDTIARGQQLATGLGSAGHATAGEISLQDAANLSDDEWSKLPEKTKARLLGG